MISVIILINGEPITGRSARRIVTRTDGYNIYRVDDGVEIMHNPEDGAIELAKKMLDTIDKFSIGGHDAESVRGSSDKSKR